MADNKLLRFLIYLAALLAVSLGEGADVEEAAPIIEVPVCLLAPLYYAPVDNGTSLNLSPTGLHLTRGILLAVRHINSAYCGLLESGCESRLLDGSAEGGRLRLRPHLLTLHEGYPQSAASAVKTCLSTEAQIITGAITSSQAGLVASFVGGIDRMMLSSTASSPAFADNAVFPNFARTETNHGENMKAVVHLTKFFGWRQVVLIQKQDLYGAPLAEVFMEFAQANDIQSTVLGVGTAYTDAILEGKMHQLVESELRVVVLLVFPTEVLRFLRAAHRVITDAGLDYTSYTWICASVNTETISASVAIYSDKDDDTSFNLELLEGLLGVSTHYPEEGRIHLEEGLEEETSEVLRTDIERYFTGAPGTYWTGGVSDTESFAEQWSRVSALGTSDFLINSYDAVWAAAIGIAAATGQGKNATQVTGRDVMALMEAGQFPVFQGAGGTRAFLPNGDMNLSNTFIEISNYGTPSGASQPRNAIVARIELDSYSVETMENVVWANGREYPDYVPPDGMGMPAASRPAALLWVLVACAVGLGLLLLVSAALVVRNRRLRARVSFLVEQVRNDMPLESPMAKMLEFLRRYQGQRWSRPTQDDARLLETLIVSHSNSLTVPDLERMDDLNGAGIRDFLLLNMRQSGGGPDALRRQQESTSTVSSSTDIVYEENFINAVPMKARFGSFLEYNGVQQLSRFDSRRVSQEGEACRVEVPGPLREAIAQDWFLDLVTPQSPFSDSPSPLVVVAQQSIERLGLLSSCPASQLRLLRFTSLVEAGYPDHNYHCKLHGADVTNRLMTMLSAAGLASLSATPHVRQSQSVGLVSIVAAMIHDYNHPQVNNAFLVEEEHEMALEFNNQAVAEHFALRETMKLLMDSDTNFLKRSGKNRRGGIDELGGRLARVQRKRFRDLVIQVVLATDMSRHFELLSQFETQIVQNRDLRAKGSTEAMWTAMNDSQRMLILQIAMKVADIGHCALPMNVHRIWVQRLETEFFLQGDREKEAGLPISPLMDRKLLGATAPENQVGFFKVIVLPLLRAWTDVFPSSSPLKEQAEENLAFYSSQVTRRSMSITSGKRCQE